jgi:DNA-binding NarL/FixJ family response regulator
MGMNALLVISRSEIFCAGVERLLAGDPELKLVAALGDYGRAQGLARQNKPVTVLVDVGADADEAVELIQKLSACSGVRVLAVTDGWSPRSSGRALRAGAQVVTDRGNSLVELRCAVMQASGDGCGRQASCSACDSANRLSHIQSKSDRFANRLVAVERRVLRLMADGCNDSAIRRRLRLTQGDYQRVQGSLSEAAGTDNLAHLTKFALRAGLTRLNGVSRH